MSRQNEEDLHTVETCPATTAVVILSPQWRTQDLQGKGGLVVGDSESNGQSLLRRQHRHEHVCAMVGQGSCAETGPILESAGDVDLPTVAD